MDQPAAQVGVAPLVVSIQIATRSAITARQARSSGHTGEGARFAWLALGTGICASRRAVEFWKGLARRHARK